ncbi:MAG: superfamily II DNA or RNA helicase [Planctomycetota bacterium]|jgi:superfamily II DNA or RNA helicase
MTFELRPHFTLEPWQQDAVDAWLASDSLSLGPRHGILEIYTGAGKTIVALGAIAAVLRETPQTKVAIVVPTIALAQQWANAIPERTTISATRVGMVGGECNDGFDAHDVLVYVLASARAGAGKHSRLAADVEAARARKQQVFLVVDECHKAGAPSSSKIFDARTHARLGLSATPRREGADAQDELGQVLPLEHQLHGRALGGVCYRLSLRDGYTLGMLPRYEIHHHGISLTGKEQEQHSLLTHRVTQARQDVARAGGSPDRYLAYLTGRGGSASGAVVKASAALQSAYLERKHFLYQASERLRVVERILVDSWHDERLGAPKGAVLFNERIGDAAPQQQAESDESANPEEQQLVAGAESLCLRVKRLAELGELPFAPSAVAIEHSRLSAATREAALDGLRSGEVQVLVSVKALQEGIDIPDVGLGVSVASTASARQRIQTMGRILRPARNATGKRLPPDEAPVKRLHLLYVRGTVDEEIYKRTDWNDATGAERNNWWEWSLTDQAPQGGEELAPTDVDEAPAWERVAEGPFPMLWEGPTQGLPLVHKQGRVWVVLGEQTLPVDDDAPIIKLLEAGKRRGAYPDARGRFSVSPRLNVVLKRSTSPKDPARQITLALGRLEGPPMWPGKGQEPKEMAAGSAASATTTSPESASSSDPIQNSATLSPPTLSKSAPKNTSGGKSTAPWFVLVQEGYLAAVAGNHTELERIADALSGQRKAWIHEAVQVIAEGTGWPEGADETPPTGMESLLPYVGKAFVSGRADLLRRACESFKIGKAQKPKRVAIANALAILAGKANELCIPEE